MAYKKDHDNWNVFHKNIDGNSKIPFFKKREVWWTAIGINVGHEEDGKGEQFSRPVLVLSKFGKHTFVGIPFSTTKRIGKNYYHINFGGIENTVLLAQIKTFDSRRLIKRYGIIEESVFQEIRKAAKDLL